VHTGQHYDEEMSEVFFRELGIPRPHYNLGIGNLSHGAMTGRQLEQIERVLEVEKPTWMVVYGDTNSTLAGALAGAKMNIPVAHVEAGLRSYNRVMPEEINRVVVDHLSTLLFAPTDAAVRNLQKEGIAGDLVLQTGDVMFDVALYFGARARTESRVLEELRLEHGSYVLATIHRQENVDDPRRLRSIIEGLGGAGIPVLLPLHPRTRERIRTLGIPVPPAIRLLDPLGYIDMARLEQSAAVIATDSGGVQREAFFHRIPCVVLRTETEWTELVELGWNRLAPPESAAVISDAIKGAHGMCGLDASPYGRGDAAEVIVDALLRVASYSSTPNGVAEA
jgi:UDP-GlcNAc3NAcA epimerase